jgi:metal-responsive CopG/Arc/MetJ family transcriptional regulator
MKRPITKKRVSFALNTNLWEQFKKIADKDQRKYSNIVEASMKKYIAEKKDNLFKDNIF